MGVRQVMVGRDRELARLSELLAAAATGVGGAALVSGEAGIGKSLLAATLADRATEQGFTVVRADAFVDEGAPFALWRRTRPRLLAVETAADERLDAEGRRWDVVDEVVAGLRARSPALLVVEDLHWADPSSIWALEHVMRELADGAVAVVATVRTTGEPPPALVDLLRHADQVVVAGLDRAAVAQLAGSRDPDALLDATGGNPLLLRELAAGAELSASGLALLAHALAPLDPTARRVVQVLALIAPLDAPSSVVAATLDIDPKDVVDAVAAAVAVDVLTNDDDGRGPRLRHDLLGQAALAELTDGEQRELHVALAEAWSSLAPTLAQRAAIARHRMAALPLGDVDLALTAVRDAMSTARDDHRLDVASETGRLTSRALRSGAVAPSAVAVEVLVDLGDVLADAGDLTTAAEVSAQAAEIAPGIATPDVIARAEVGATRAANLIVPNPERIRRLEEAEAHLPPGDDPLRVGLLARLAVLGVAGTDLSAAHAHGDAAIAMARRLDEPALIASAIVDRHIAPGGLGGLLARAAAADEVVTLGSRLRRPDLTAVGLEWQVLDHADVGAVDAAAAALDQLELLGAVAPSPRWRYVALLRRAGLRTIAGDRDGALEAIAAAAELGASVVDGTELAGLEIAGRLAIATLWDAPFDDRIRALYATLVARVGHVPVPFLQVQMARLAYRDGDDTRAREVVDRFGPQLDRVLATMAGEVTAPIVAELAVDLGVGAHAAGMARVLAPLRDRLGVGNLTEVRPPIATVAGSLALLGGDHATALDLLGAGLALAERARSPVLARMAHRRLAEACDVVGDATGAREHRAAVTRLAAELGIVTANPAPSPIRAGGAVLAREGGAWRLSSPLGEAVLPHSLGIAQLARLLAVPDVPVAASALVPAEVAGSGGDLGAMLDARAKREYRRRVAELQAVIEEAEDAHDPARAERARAELDALLAELRRAVGLGGRDRPHGSADERARLNVTRSLRRAIAAITAAAPALGAHLDRSVRTGRDCCYTPEPAAALLWDVRP